ncbi:hypothetical protein Tco_0923408 [Tanacetum coccineum]|uniref:Uncharacterized protein n=1 Tax=Tanacetum coccineum TaxID=301880 RepID=A0ABQ5D1U8_9ASTR
METEVAKCSVQRKTFEIKEKELLIENDRLLELIMSQDLVHNAVNSLAEIINYQSMEKSFLDEYSKCVKLKAELSKKNEMVEKFVYDEPLKRCARMENICKGVSEGVKSESTSKVIAMGMYNLDLEPLSPMLLRNREAHVDYLKNNQEHADFLYDIVEHARDLRPLDSDLDYACKFATRVQELLVYVRDRCPSSSRQNGKLIAVTPINKVKKVRFAKPSISSSNIQKQVDSCKTKDSNKPLLPSTRVVLLVIADQSL